MQKHMSVLPVGAITLWTRSNHWPADHVGLRPLNGCAAGFPRRSVQNTQDIPQQNAEPWLRPNFGLDSCASAGLLCSLHAINLRIV
mmetsp:Transcript_146827/g.366160  ORF Transcript_146827/g.366160 Transcript_146827/m.366160 type:complete len:86 (-) Transcript_146827:162-419(-)